MTTSLHKHFSNVESYWVVFTRLENSITGQTNRCVLRLRKLKVGKTRVRLSNYCILNMHHPILYLERCNFKLISPWNKCPLLVVNTFTQYCGPGPLCWTLSGLGGSRQVVYCDIVYERLECFGYITMFIKFASLSDTSGLCSIL